MAIQPRASLAKIVPKTMFHYDAASFEEQKLMQFKEATAEQVLDEIKPACFDFLPEKKLIAIDTETFYTGLTSNRIPASVVPWLPPQGS